MKISKNKVVEVAYELEVDGKIIDVAEEKKPLDYIQGANMLLPKFEEILEGKEAGYEFSFTLNPEEGYGEYNDDNCIELPKSAFEVNGEIKEELLKIGNIIPMLDGQEQVVRGIVSKIEDNKVTMDFNHPMAGKVLNFKGKVISVREATEKELTEGLHGEFLPHECHCGHHHEDGKCCGHGKGHHHEDGECCGHGKGHHHEDGECCGHGKGHHHEDGECCGHSKGHHHEDGECCGKHKEDKCQEKNKN